MQVPASVAPIDPAGNLGNTLPQDDKSSPILTIFSQHRD
jgi:hypothetical protein